LKITNDLEEHRAVCTGTKSNGRVLESIHCLMLKYRGRLI